MENEFDACDLEQDLKSSSLLLSCVFQLQKKNVKYYAKLYLNLWECISLDVSKGPFTPLAGIKQLILGPTVSGCYSRVPERTIASYKRT